MARSYDYLTRRLFAGYWQRWQGLALEELQGRRVLEIGFGTGDLLCRIAARGFEAYGLDRSRQLARVARRKLRLCPHPVAVVRGEAGTLPFKSQVFDGIVVTFPAPWIRSEQAQREMARVLRAGGRLIVVDAGEVTDPSRRWWPRRLLLRLAYGRAATCPSYLPGTLWAGNWRSIRVGQSYVHVFAGTPKHRGRSHV